ncbi:hypothetical protein NH8B_2423 [Pseudogulbenkiania sp. NH8B]|uniref:hypothetical protein n=1 Tax=Pseudogulbenkiania sp. (strain NH8B) TaxID=748280 RepID=UPI0002279F91|nr:hypothetical protein [Pseudogulbenkiania sp. NH8B]BAK77237.1 hypothetical protein NH8B_2423 [Pseudogulbenkiania sp. NH8B]
MDSNHFSRIVILDSIPHGELNTAKRLYDDLQMVASTHAPTPAIEYLRIESAQELIQFLSRCRDEVNHGREVPMLHIECHGDEEGFGLADGSLLDWPELKLPLTELNVATQLNLMISVAACTGGALAKVISMGERAPIWGLIGPTRSVYPHELEDSFRALYATLFETKSPALAVKAMDSASTTGTFWRTTAQGLFEKGWNSYKETYCTPAAMEVRAKRMLERIKNLRPAPYPSLEELKKRLVDVEPSAYEQYVATFFMYDLFPLHSQRFQLSLVSD